MKRLEEASEGTHLGNCRIGIGSRLLHDIKADEVLVVIDNLRASSTVVAGLYIGVEEIIPVLDDEEAFSLKEKGIVIAGESDGIKIPGYDIGNSPAELVKTFEKSPFKKLVLRTTNMIPLLSCLPSALICSSLNLETVAEHLEGKNACIIAVGGTRGASEDLGVAFALSACLSRVSFDKNLVTCFTKESLAAKHLGEIGYREDIDFISRVSIFDVLPLYDGKTIKKARG